MKQALYLECTSGFSGDMMAAALLDLGADEEKLRQILKRLPVEGFDIRISRVKKSGLDACDFDVALDHDHENHDHDMEYLFGKQEAAHSHVHAHHHEHRGMREISQLIEGAGLSDRARKTALSIFQVLAEAEAKAHGTTPEEVHFHEVGAVDSIVDIIAVAVCLDDLDIEHVIVPALWEGRGTIRCQHGILPIPVPAVANIAKRYGLKLHIMEDMGEFVTPTGAAIAAAIRTEDCLPAEFSIRRIGLGAGKRNYERPGILRAMLIEAEAADSREQDVIYKLECNMDDCTGEALGYAMECLLDAGARDVCFTPVFMKKNRPAYQLNVICAENQISLMERIIFRETTTIGIRRVKMERSILKRKESQEDTSFGKVNAKCCEIPGAAREDESAWRVYPEYSRDRKSTRLNSSHIPLCRMPSSA